MTRSTRRHDHPLVRAVLLLDVRWGRAGWAVLVGAGGLGSAVALAAVSAWLIARASQMPPVMQLSIAAVAVRTFGISRGVLRYLERLLSHDVALRGMVRLREELYRRLAAGRPGPLLARRRGDLLHRVGADVDAVGDLVVRSLLPAAVAVLVGAGSVVLVGVFLPSAGAALAAGLILSGVLAPWWTVRAVRATEHASAQAREDLSAGVLHALDGAAELTVAGRLPQAFAALEDAERRLARATDRGAGPLALATATTPWATGATVLAALLLGIPATTAGVLSPVELAVVVLTPLAAFEAVSLLPAAAVQAARSAEAARRIVTLLDEVLPEDTLPGGRRTDRHGAHGSGPGAPLAQPGPPPDAESLPAPLALAGAPGPRTVLRARDLVCGYPGRPVVHGLDLDLTAGHRVAVVGPSGTGKTTTLLTLAGLLPALDGHVEIDGAPAADLTGERRRRAVALTPEDAHLFDTSVLENLRVARGGVTPDEAEAALESVGLAPWLRGLPEGVDTVLGPDATRVSGGERRRLLLARALVSPAALLLLDEPTEHLETDDAVRIQRGLLDGSLAPGRGVLVVTHRLAGLEAADEVILLGAGGSVRARGTHAELLTVPTYRDAWTLETQETR